MLMLENKYPKVVVHNRAPNYHADRVHICCIVQQCTLLRKQYTHINTCNNCDAHTYSIINSLRIGAAISAKNADILAYM